MKKSLCVLITAVIFLVLIGGYVFSSRSPYIAIRKHLMMIDPVQAVKCGIQPTAIADFGRGTPYIIGGFIEDTWGYRIYNVHVKRNGLGLYYVTSIVGAFDTEANNDETDTD